jgi:enamine deaminase RidA (YjgF/YER057c/UK114 family)
MMKLYSWDLRLVKIAAGALVLTTPPAIGCGDLGMAQAAPQQLIPSAGGEVAITSQAQQTAYKSWHYASARRAEDYVYISGVVISRKPGESNTPATFKEQARAAFQRIGTLLNAFGGDRKAQFEALRSIKDEFMTEPYPAWTAVGTSGMIRSQGIVEIQMVAYVTQHRGSDEGEQKQDDRAAYLDRTDGAP